MKKTAILTLLLSGAYWYAYAQVPPTEQPVNINIEQQLENITESSDDLEPEDDSYLLQFGQLLKNPVNINEVDESFFKEMRFITPMQVQNFFLYRNLLGKLISIYELQAIPGWDLATIHRIVPYITVSNVQGFANDMGTRFKNGNHIILLRVSQTLEKSKGYLLDSNSATNYYLGSPQRIFLRYRYTYKNNLQFGMAAEKDAGEEFFKGSQKQGFDYYSAHLFVRNVGIVKLLAIGDFTVNMGQGLTQWMSLAFRKGPDVMAVKRQSSILRAYNSSGEIYYHRGAGLTIGKKNWQATFFGAARKVDANFSIDTSSSQTEFVSSLQTSGLHRTKSEVEDKGAQRQLAFGGNISYLYKKLQVGINVIQFNLKYPLIKPGDPYNLYALSGKNFGNYSADYSYTYKNMHFFGEVAITDKQYVAVVNGLLLSVANNVDMSFFYRNISKGYQSLYTSAFTENTYPTNEKGFFTGISIRPNMNFRIDAYADVYRFPWLKYRVNAPTNGQDYMVQLYYRPNKQVEIYTRYRVESKPINFNPYQLIITPVLAQPRKDWRTYIGYRLNNTITFRSRAEVLWFDKNGPEEEQGFLLATDILYNPMMKPFSGNIRLQYFETDGYNSRIYAYENDVLYSFSIPAFYDKGYRVYINMSYNVTKKITLWGRWSRSIYPEKNSIGSGLDEINGGKRTTINFQLMYKF